MTAIRFFAICLSAIASVSLLAVLVMSWGDATNARLGMHKAIEKRLVVIEAKR